jgi:hypothetical protein
VQRSRKTVFDLMGLVSRLLGTALTRNLFKEETCAGARNWFGLLMLLCVVGFPQLRPQKLPRAKAGARKRKMAAARQAARRSRLRQAEKDGGARAEGGKGKEKMEGNEDEEELELEDVEASEGDLVEVTDPSL